MTPAPATAVADPQPPVRGLRGRAVWVLADQAVSSVANAGLTIVIARAVSPGQYGAFAVAFTIYTFAVSFAQAFAGQIVIVRFSDAVRSRHREASSQAAGISLGVGAAGLLLLLALQFTVSTSTRTALGVLAVLLPALLLQDLWRTAFISRGTPRDAFLNDLVWTLLQAAGIAVLLIRSVHTVAPYMIVWGGAAVVAAGIGCRQNGALPRLRGGGGWLREHRRLGTPILANTLATVGLGQIAFLGIATIGSVAALGSIRAAQTLLGPLNIVSFAATSFAVPELVRRQLSPRALMRAGLIISTVLVAVDLLWGGALLLLPDSAGRALLGDTWAGARTGLPGMVALTCGLSATAGATAVMRAVARNDLVLRSGLIAGPLLVVFAVAGVRLDGEAGAALGFAIASYLAVPCTWWLLRLAVNSMGTHSSATPETSPPDGRRP